MNPFRIAIIDDDFYDTVEKVRKQKGQMLNLPPESAWDFLNALPKNGQTIQVFLVRDGQFGKRAFSLTTGTNDISSDDFKGGGLRNFLRTLHVLILDLGGITLRMPVPTPSEISANLQRCVPASQIPTKPVVTLSQTDIDPIVTGDFSGVGFFHKHLDDLMLCKAVVILTKFHPYHATGENWAVNMMWSRNS